jgi:hypothetical protein
MANRDGFEQMRNSATPVGRAIPTPEFGQVLYLTAHPTAHLTEEQKKWPVVRVVPSDTEGVALLVPVDAPRRPAEILPAVADMLSAGRAGDAEAVFARLRAAGMSLKTEIGDDGVLHVTVVGA